jgi:hypothetical protein
MTDAVIQGEYAGLKPVKTRKVWVLEIEIPEEKIKHVTDIMGFPNQSENQWVGVALLDKSVIEKTVSNSTGLEKTEGEKMVTQAVMMCKDKMFQEFCSGDISLEFGACSGDAEYQAQSIIYNCCEINSRSELKEDICAQIRFKELVEQFKDWKFENNYEDNLSREG